jgi:hypothetical protein
MDAHPAADFRLISAFWHTFLSHKLILARSPSHDFRAYRQNPIIP